jgi:filamentous hemagglutinin family protein
MNAGRFKTVFSNRLGTLVAVGEHASSQGKANGASVGAAGFVSTDWLSNTARYVGVLSSSFALVSVAWAGPVAPSALPTGGQVAQGAASIHTSGAVMSITQSTAKAVLNWATFDIGQNAKVNIVQPGADAVMLNRVTSANPSQILGQLNANGQVVLVNPNGVLFGKDGSVNANSFTASTLGITDANFMAGNQQFERNGSTAAVVNQGSIKTTGGYVALLGASVSNEGQIQTQGGTAYLAAAETVKILVSGSGRIQLELSPSRINAAVANAKGGTLVTEGGQVYMQAAALSSAVASIIQSGSIDTTGAQGGAVHLLADGGQIKVDGSITANSTNVQNKGGDIVIGRDEETGVLAKATDVSVANLQSSGGLVETSGGYLKSEGVVVHASNWLLDPVSVEINATATPVTAGNSVVTSATINTALNAGTSVTISTGAGTGTTSSATGVSLATTGATQGGGSITLNDAISKTAGGNATFTLAANSDIFLTAGKTISSSSGALSVVLNSGSSGGTGGISMASGSGITSNGGSVTLGGGSAGTGAGAALGSTLVGFGITMSGASISSGAGNVTLTGTSYTSGNSIWGVNLDSGATITTTSGNVNITSTGQTNGQYGYGMMIQGAGTKVTTGTGNITVTATSSATSSSDGVGIQIRSAGALTTGGGNILLTATSRGVSGSANIGMGFIGGSLIAGGSGTVTLIGTGTGGCGVCNPTITTSGGAVSITGLTSSTATGSSDINVASGVISTSGGGISFTGDSYTGGGTESINAGSGTVSIQNRTAGTLITLGGAVLADSIGTTPKTLVVDSTELGKITAANTVIGRNDASGSGNITVSTINMGALGNTGGNLTVLSGNDITVSAAITKTAGTDATLTLTAKNGVDINAGIGSISNKLNVQATANGLGGSTKGLTLSGSTVNANGGAVNFAGNNASSGNGVNFNGTLGITAATYTVRGSAAMGNGVYFTSTGGTSTFTSSTGNSLIEGTNTSGGAKGLFIYAGNTVNVASGAGTAVLASSATSATGIRIGYGGGVTMNTSGDVTIGSKNNNTADLFMQANVNATSGRLSIVGKSESSFFAIGLQDGGGIGSKITGTNGAQIRLDGESGSGIGVNLLPAGGANTITASGAGSAITITGVSATNTGIFTGASTITNNAGGITLTGTSSGSSGYGIQAGGGAISSSGTLSLTGNAGGKNAIFSSSALSSTGADVVISATANGTSSSYNSDANNTIAATGGLTVNINKAGIFNGVISGGASNAGGLIKQGAGTMTLSNANTFKGIALVSAGTLELNHANALQNSTLDTGASGAQQVTFALAGANTYNIGGLQGADEVALGGNRISVGGNNSATLYSGVVSGAGGLTKVGTGVLTLTGDNTFVDSVYLSGGTLQVGNAGATGALGGAAVVLANNATLSYVRSTDSVIAHVISGTGNVLANITSNNGVAGNLTINNSITLTGSSSANTISLRANGNLTLSHAISTSNATAYAVTLVSGQDKAAGNSTGGDIVVNGSGAITVAAGGIAKLFSGAIAGTTGISAMANLGSGRFRYNSTENTTNYTQGLSQSSGVSNSGVGIIYREAPTVQVTANSTLTGLTYNGLAQTGNEGFSLSGALQNGDASALLTGVMSYSYNNNGDAGHKNAGTYTVTASGQSSALGYRVTTVAGSLVIGQKEVQLTAAKTYDGGKNLSGNQLTITTGVGSETLSYSAATINSKNVADNSINYVDAVTLTDGSNGGKASNYKFTPVRSANNTVTMGQAALTLTANSGTGNVYNGAEQQVSGFAITGGSLKGNDSVAVDLAGISAGGQGTDVGSYTTSVNDSAYANANYAITKATGALVIGQKEVQLRVSKEYDGGKALSGNQLIITTGVGAETLGYSAATIRSKNVADNSTNFVDALTLTDGSNGGKASNYKFIAARSASNTVFLTPRALTGSITPVHSTYGDALAVGAVSLTNNVLTDDVHAAGVTIDTAGFASTSGHLKAGSYTGIQSVTALSGADASNYTFANLKGDYQVDKLVLTGMTIGTANKTYGEAVLAGAVNFSASNLKSGDVVQAVGHVQSTPANLSTSGNLRVGSYDQKVSTLSSGNANNDADNYSFSAVTNSVSYTVAKKVINSAQIAAVTDAVYGTAKATGAVSLGADVVAGDQVRASNVATVKDPVNSSSDNLKAGDYKQTVASGLSSGNANNDADNYDFAGVTSSTANYRVEKLALLTQIADVNTVYGSSAATGATQLTGLLQGDAVNLAAPAVLEGMNFSGSGKLKVGTYRQVVGSALSGLDADNYIVTPATTSNYTVSPKAISATVVAADKVYDGSNVASMTAQSSDVYAGDSVLVLGVTGTFSSKNVARDSAGNVVAQTVIVSGTGVGFGGPDGGNYTLNNATSIASTTATIAPKVLTATGFTAADKVYDGNTTTVVSAGNIVLTGMLSGDSVGVSGQNASGNFASKNVVFDAGGSVTTQAVAVSGLSLSGADAANYSVVDKSGATAKVLPRALGITGSVAQNKTVDGSTQAQIKPGQLINLVGGESLVVSATGQFADALVGVNKLVATRYALINGSNGIAANYLAPSPEVRRASIVDSTVNPVQPIVSPVRPVSIRRTAVAGSSSTGAAQGLNGAPDTTSESCSGQSAETCE